MTLRNIASMGAGIGALSSALRLAVQPASLSGAWVMIAAVGIFAHAAGLAAIFVLIALVFGSSPSRSS
jgi:hypothetical protein